MRKWILLGLIVVVAAIVRFWMLGQVPISPDWDEASLGYNAYSILHTGKDEYGVFLPIVLKSFGDYKPALYAYLSIPSVAIFGLTTFAVRLPSAILGTITVLLTFFLAEELFNKKSIALLSSFLFAISPWSIQFSRVAFETNGGIFFNILGALLFLKGLKKPILLVFSAISFALSLYIYQSEKVFTPALLLLLVIIYRKRLFSFPKKWLMGTVLTGVFVALPMIVYTLSGTGGLARAQGVSIFSSTSTVSHTITDRYTFNKLTQDKLGLLLDNERFLYAKTIIANYLSHFDLNWLFITGDLGRHHAPNMGIVYIWELPFILIGMYELLFGAWDKKTKLLIIGWFLIAALPAAITTDVPHAVRTMNFLPTYQIFSALGIIWIFSSIYNKKSFGIPWGKFLLGVVAIIAILNIVYYFDQYFVQQNYYDRKDWQYGYAQIVPYANELGKDYQHIVVTSQGPFDQSYIFFLFYLKYDPVSYQKEATQNTLAIHSFGKYTFRPIQWATDVNLRQDTLFIGTKDDFSDPVLGIKKVFYNNDGTILAKIVGNH